MNQNKILINQDKILSNQRHYEFIENLKVTNNIRSKKILLVFHYLGIIGAPITVFNTAIELKKRGYYVLLLSFEGGDLSCKEGIDIYVSTKLNNNKINYLWRITEAESIETKFTLEYQNIPNVLRKSKNISNNCKKQIIYEK